MKFGLLLCVLLSVLVLASPALAQEPGDVGVFFDMGGTQSQGFLSPFVPFFLYVVGFDLQGDVFGYEGSLSYDPANMILLSAVFTGPGPVNIGTNDNWIVGTGGCISGFGPVVLVQFQFLPLAPVIDSLFCLGPAIPSSFVPPTPGYLTCGGVIIPFGTAQNGGGVYPNACAVGNPTVPEYPIGTDVTSWSSIKSTY